MAESLRGCFLIAGCRLRDPNFFKTAVLLIEHGSDGAMGVVINRPSSVTVANALSGQFDLPATEQLVYVGGPVEPAALFILHGAGELDPEERAVLPGLFAAGSADVFEQVVRSAETDGEAVPFRVYSGCAGWAPGQLEGELARGDWFVVPGAAEYVFHLDPYAVWDLLLADAYRRKRLLPVQCDHPEWN